MKRNTASGIVYFFNLLSIIGLAILNFCPVMVMKRAPSDSIRVYSSVSPFLNVYSVSTVFLLLIPLILYFLLAIVSCFVRKMWLNILGLLLSICVFIVFICMLFAFEFTLAGRVFGLLLTILIVVSSGFELYLGKNIRGNL